MEKMATGGRASTSSIADVHDESSSDRKLIKTPPPMLAKSTLTPTDMRHQQHRRQSSLPDFDEELEHKMTKLLRSRQLSDQSPAKRVNFRESDIKPHAPFFMKSFRHRMRNRLLQQDGMYNISLSNVRDPGRRYCSDMWTTLIEVKWRWALLVFSMGFILSWLFFAIIYFCILYTHGDLDNRSGAEWIPCIQNVNSFAAAFLYSLETQTTIGYGFRYPSDACPEVIYAVCLQSMFGVVIQALMVGVVFAKMIRPKKRAQTICFSRQAVLSMRNNRLCFMFRLGDMRKSQLSNILLRVFLIRKHITMEGEVMPFYLHELKCKVGDVDGCPLLTWPATVCHSIEKDSPLYEYAADDLAGAKFEIIVVLDGVIPINGVSTQARTSYLPSEIMWGYRLDGLMTYQRDNGEYRIDYGKFHSIHQVWTPTCSARQLDDIINLGMDPADWYKEARRRAEMIESPECTFTPIAPAPIRRKVTEIFVNPMQSPSTDRDELELEIPAVDEEKADDDRHSSEDESTKDASPSPPHDDEQQQRMDKNREESISLLLDEDEAPSQISRFSTSRARDHRGSLPVKLEV